nr:MAG TPA: peptidase [Caudoviricetes sp.]DAG20231.1 MAG TPA: peptidase [Caudoviricetes sp.]
MTTTQVQSLLLYLGYPVGAPDGITGSQTRQAVKLFQAAEGLTADGDPGQETQTALLAAVAAGRMYTPAKTENAKTGAFWDEIRYFRREEFRCQCGGKYCNGFPAEPVEETVRLADEIRRRAGVPLNVNSGVRCRQHNADVDGVWNSLHLTGQAVDLAPIGGNISAEKLQQIARDVTAEKIPGRGGLGCYSWGVHIDNGKYSRWTK